MSRRSTRAADAPLRRAAREGPRIVALSIAFATAIATCDVIAQTSPTFDVVSIKPNRSGSPDSGTMWNPLTGVTMTNGLVLSLIRSAYPAQNRDIEGAPDWAGTERYDVIAKPPAGPRAGDDIRDMMRAMLADRFKLRAHYETRDEPVYRLVVARGDGHLGDQIRPSGVDCDAAARRSTEKRTSAAAPNVTAGCGTHSIPGLIESTGIPMRDLAAQLTGVAGRVVIDATALTGRYDLTLRYSPQPSGADDGPSVFTAVQEQLGLKLESSRAPLQTLVVDHLERPTEN